MRFLVAEKLGPHKFKTPEGYLICTDAILSRTGKQEYKRCELFGDTCEDPDKIVNVERTDDEVFSDKAMASFENKAVCIEHPDHNVNAENHNELAVGFVRDIHKGEDNGKPVMMGTLVITDKDAVEAVESGEYKELSCGYDCDIDDDSEPCQRNIRGNHVALCKQGRAGIARIVDSVDDAGIKVWQVRQGYAIVVKRYWKQYGRNAFVDATESSIEAARYHRGSLERNDKMEFVIVDCNDGKYKIEDEGMKDIQATKTPGTDKIIYVMQSDIDKNLYFYIGKMFSMKEGAWGYTKFEMGNTRPDELKSELTRNGWHQVTSGPARVIDISDGMLSGRYVYFDFAEVKGKSLKQEIERKYNSRFNEKIKVKRLYKHWVPGRKEVEIQVFADGMHENYDGFWAIVQATEEESKQLKDDWTEVVTDEIMKDESRQTLIEKLRTVSVPYDERYALTSGSGWHIDIQHHGQASYENINKYPHASPKESSKATIRLWYNGKHMKTFEGPLNSAKSDAIRYLQTRTEDSWSSVEEENYNKANKPVGAKDASVTDANVIASSEHTKIGKDWYGYFFVKHSKYGDFYVSFKIKGRRNEVQLDGTGWDFIKSTGYTSEQKAWIAQHKSNLERIYSMGTVADSKEQLFTVEYEQDGVTYIRKVRADSIEDAISKVKDVYNKFEHETDKEYLKSSINEMSRYISNWPFMTTREKRNISPEGLGALKQMLKFAQQRLAELK